MDSGTHHDLFKSPSTSPSRPGRLIQPPAFLQGKCSLQFSDLFLIQAVGRVVSANNSDRLKISTIIPLQEYRAFVSTKSMGRC